MCSIAQLESGGVKPNLQTRKFVQCQSSLQGTDSELGRIRRGDWGLAWNSGLNLYLDSGGLHFLFQWEDWCYLPSTSSLQDRKDTDCHSE